MNIDTVTEDVVRALGEQVGYGRLMQLCQELWHAREIAAGRELSSGALTCGPCHAFMVPCHHPVIDSNGHCDLCCGSGRIAKGVLTLSIGYEHLRESLASLINYSLTSHSDSREWLDRMASHINHAAYLLGDTDRAVVIGDHLGVNRQSEMYLDVNQILADMPLPFDYNCDSWATTRNRIYELKEIADVVICEEILRTAVAVACRLQLGKHRAPDDVYALPDGNIILQWGRAPGVITRIEIEGDNRGQWMRSGPVFPTIFRDL